MSLVVVNNHKSLLRDPIVPLLQAALIQLEIHAGGTIVSWLLNQGRSLALL